MNIKIPSSLYDDPRFLELCDGEHGASNGLIFHLLLCHLNKSHTIQFLPSSVALVKTLGRPSGEISSFMEKAAQIGFIEVESEEIAYARYVEDLKEATITSGCKRMRKFRSRSKTSQESVTVTPYPVTVTPESVTTPKCIIQTGISSSDQIEKKEEKKIEYKVIEKDLWSGKHGLPETPEQEIRRQQIRNVDRGVELYNKVAEEFSLLRLDRHQVDRSSKFWTPCQDEAFLTFLDTELGIVLKTNDWHTGHNPTRWKVDADWLVSKKPRASAYNWQVLQARKDSGGKPLEKKRQSGLVTEDHIRSLFGEV